MSGPRRFLRPARGLLAPPWQPKGLRAFDYEEYECECEYEYEHEYECESLRAKGFYGLWFLGFGCSGYGFGLGPWVFGASGFGLWFFRLVFRVWGV